MHNSSQSLMILEPFCTTAQLGTLHVRTKNKPKIFAMDDNLPRRNFATLPPTPTHTHTLNLGKCTGWLYLYKERETTARTDVKGNSEIYHNVLSSKPFKWSFLINATDTNSLKPKLSSKLGNDYLMILKRYGIALYDTWTREIEKVPEAISYYISLCKNCKIMRIIGVDVSVALLVQTKVINLKHRTELICPNILGSYWFCSFDL